MDVPIIHKFYCGYAQGARAVDPDVRLIESYTGVTPAAWNDPVTAGELARAAFDQGADVVFAAAGGSGLGVLQAAADSGKFSIGVDSNQNYLHPGSVLTSMLKRVDVAVDKAIVDFLTDNFTPGAVRLGLAEEGIGYATSGGFVDDIASQLDDYANQIIDGTIVVPTEPAA
jgi:basic membrane protein A